MDAQELLTMAHEHLALGEFERVLELTADLERAGDEHGLEVRALALAASGRGGQAADLLEAAMGVHGGANPASWRLLVLFGSLCRDLGQTERARRAFALARAAPDVDEAALRLQEALLFAADGELARALEWLDRAPPSGQAALAALIDAERARLLSALGQGARALEVVDERLELVEGDDPEIFVMAELLTERARALHAAGCEREEAVEAALLAAALDPTYQPAAELLRALDDRRSGSSRLFHVVIEAREPLLGLDPPRPGLDGHCRSYAVLADSPETARAYALRYEQAPCADAVVCDEREPLPGEPMGVVAAGPARRFSGS
jgi:tetratricopeptide (TPR) repeat protein